MGGIDNAGAVQPDGVLAATRGNAYLGRVVFGQSFEIVGQLSVEHLLRGREVERVETGGANEGLGDDSRPDVPETEEPHPGFRVDSCADDLLSVLELGEDRAMKVEVEVEAVGFNLAISRCGDRRVDQTAHRDRQLSGDAEEQPKLIVGVDAGHRNYHLLLTTADRIPHRLQMGVGEIGLAQITWKRATERSGAELLPEPAVKTSRIEPGAAFRIEAHRNLVAIYQGEAGARLRELPPRAHELEPGVDQLECGSLHDDQLAAPRCG